MLRHQLVKGLLMHAFGLAPNRTKDAWRPAEAPPDMVRTMGGPVFYRLTLRCVGEFKAMPTPKYIVITQKKRANPPFAMPCRTYEPEALSAIVACSPG